MSRERTAIVVGGGIGGLATAAALVNRGWRVSVLERAAAFEEVGAGLSVWSNALRALDALGVGDEVRARAMVETSAGIRRPSGRWLARTDTEELARRFGPLVMIHRADLLEILRRAVPTEALRPGVEVVDVRAGASGAEVIHSAGADPADVVVGADGIRSTVRHAGWPDGPSPRYAGYTAWRWVASPEHRLTLGGETWGRGHRFGFAPLPDGRVYAFATANEPEGERTAGGELAELRRRFGGWHDPVGELLSATSDDLVMRHDVMELPPLDRYVSGRVALLGDAAHAMTPNLGQGACQALEDAVTLATALDAHASVSAALAAYDADRRPRTQWVARRSRLIGAVGQWSAAPAVALRTAAMRLAPRSAVLRSFTPVLSWRPPEVNPPRRAAAPPAGPVARRRQR